MLRGKISKFMSLMLLSVTLLVACSGEEDFSTKAMEKLNTKYDTTFEVTKQYKATEDKDGNMTQKGTAKSSEGYYVEYLYSSKNNTLEDNYDTAKFNGDTSKDIGNFLKMNKEDYVLYSYLNARNILEVVIALRDGVGNDAEALQKVADAYLSPVAEISVYDVSNPSFKSLKKDFAESGTLTNKTIKGYLFTAKDVYSTPFDIKLCYEDKALETTNRCRDYRDAVSNGEVVGVLPADSESDTK